MMSRIVWRGLSEVSGRLIDHLDAAQRILVAVPKPAADRLAVEIDLALLGGNRPVMARASVDLPDPDSPTTATVRPRGQIETVTLSSTLTACRHSWHRHAGP
jgi:hypothetical protein